MSKFESIDDFLSNRLSETEKAGFEKEAASDPSLQADLDLQRNIVEGIKNARRIELKAFLDNIPVGGGSFGGAGATGVKIAASALTAVVISSVVYFTVLRPSVPPQGAVPATAPVVKNEKVEPAPPTADTKEPAQASEKENSGKPSSAAPPETAKTAVDSKSKQSPSTATANQAQQPKIDVVDPSDDMVSSKGTESTTHHGGKSSNASRIAVDTDATNKTYSFHYQFTGTKLMLYGPFDKSLYEIIEINGDQKSVFLFYKGDYYLLSDKQNTITPLAPIRDQALIQKLKEYRGQ